MRRIALTYLVSTSLSTLSNCASVASPPPVFPGADAPLFVSPPHVCQHVLCKSKRYVCQIWSSHYLFGFFCFADFFCFALAYRSQIICRCRSCDGRTVDYSKGGDDWVKGMNHNAPIKGNACNGGRDPTSFAFHSFGVAIIQRFPLCPDAHCSHIAYCSHIVWDPGRTSPSRLVRDESVADQYRGRAGWIRRRRE